MPINPTPELQQRLGRLEFLANQAVEGFITGMHKSPFHGFSVEFAEHRLHNPGESTKHLDWKLYARTDKMFVKRYEEETNLRCQLVLDASLTLHGLSRRRHLGRRPHEQAQVCGPRLGGFD